MNDSGSNDIRDDLPRISVDSFQDLARVRESFNEVVIAALDAKLAERGMSYHREAFLQHIRRVSTTKIFITPFPLILVSFLMCLWQKRSLICGSMVEISTSTTKVNKVGFAVSSVGFPVKICVDTDQFDESLDRRVWSLSDQRLKWDLEIAKKRRTIPMEVENLMSDLLAKQREHSLNREAEDHQSMDEDEAIEGTCVFACTFTT